MVAFGGRAVDEPCEGPTLACPPHSGQLRQREAGQLRQADESAKIEATHVSLRLPPFQGHQVERLQFGTVLAPQLGGSRSLRARISSMG